MFSQYYLQAIDFIELRTYKPFVQKIGKKYQKTCVVSFLTANVLSS